MTDSRLLTVINIHRSISYPILFRQDMIVILRITSRKWIGGKYPKVKLTQVLLFQSYLYVLQEVGDKYI